MKDKTLGKIVVGSFIALMLTWCGLTTHKIISNRLEDKTAVAKADAEREGNVINDSRGYVAFDKNGDGKIDEIKDYRVGLIPRGGSNPYQVRYHEGDGQFERIKQKYFSQNQ